MKLLVVTAIALLDVRPSEACQPFATTQVVITPPGTTIVDGGGVLFRVATAEESPKTPPVAPATLPGEKEEPLAPGLFRRIYQPSADRKITLAPTVVFPQGGKAAALAAPKLASVSSNLKRGTTDHYNNPGAVVITLAAAPPADAFAIVIQSEGRGVAWVPIQPGQKVYSVGFGGKGCGGEVYAMPVPQGSRVTAVYLDRAGRTSAITAPLAVAARK
jgi:hypothetical protein